MIRPGRMCRSYKAELVLLSLPRGMSGLLPRRRRLSSILSSRNLTKIIMLSLLRLATKGLSSHLKVPLVLALAVSLYLFLDDHIIALK